MMIVAWSTLATCCDVSFMYCTFPLLIAEFDEKEPRVPIRQTFIGWLTLFMLHISCLCVCVCTCVCPYLCVSAELKSLIEEALHDRQLTLQFSNSQAAEPRPSTVLARESEEQSKRFIHTYIHTYMHAYKCSLSICCVFFDEAAAIIRVLHAFLFMQMADLGHRQGCLDPRVTL